MSTAVEQRPGYVAGGDAIRGYACLLVVAAHCQLGLAAYYLGPRAAGDPAGAFPVIGDWMIRFNAALYPFFVLSGYLVGGPWVRAWLRGERWPDLRAYMSRRLRRIIPGYWVSIVFALVVLGSFSATKGQLLELFTFTHTLRPVGPPERVMPQAWTLCIEFAFYLALPLIFLGAAKLNLVPSDARRRRRIFYIGAGVITLISLQMRAKYQLDHPAGRWFPALSWAIIPGMVLAAVEHDHRAQIAASRRAKPVAITLFVAAIAAWLLTVAGKLADGNLVSELCYLVMAGGFLGSAMIWQWTTGGVPRWADNKPIHALGRWSFGIYILHVTIGRELIDDVLPSGMQANVAFVVTFAITATVAIAAASLLWWLVEEPFIDKRPPNLDTWRNVVRRPRPPVEEVAR